jgi:hypothetical protein
MRLWSLHPRHLDPAGLVALWREALLARKVLAGRTKGYRRHPQLDRFRSSAHPRTAIARYLMEILTEARRRGYAFDGRKAPPTRAGARLAVTRGQVRFERAHLLRKLRLRRPDLHRRFRRERATVHPLFRVTPGPVADWERP